MTKHPVEWYEARSEKVPWSGCWIWMRYTSKWRADYGWLTKDKRQFFAHRSCYADLVGEIPQGMRVLHRCDVYSCVNPDHLFLGTQADNIRDMVSKQRHCQGMKQWLAKLTDADALHIKVSDENQRVLAERFGIAKEHVSKIRAGKAWRHLNQRAAELRKGAK